MRAEFVNPFLTSFIHVLETMAQLELTPEKARRKENEIAYGDVSGLIGMVGKKTRGSFSISFEKPLALEIMRRMLGEKPDHIDNAVTDMVGEITNMVTGGAKRILETSGFEFDMATPAVVSGPSHSITHKGKGQTIIMPFASAYGKAYIEICFD